MPTSAVEQLVLARTFGGEVIAPLAPLFSQLGISAQVNYCAPTDNSALNLNLEGQLRLGRITLWQDGNYHSEALQVSDGATVHSLHGRASSAANISTVVRQLACIVADGSAHIGC